MNIQFNPNISSPAIKNPIQPSVEQQNAGKETDFGKTLLNTLQKTNEDQSQSNASIMDLLGGKQQDINAVVASVAKSDMSFKLLVGVRNKLVEAYKETMRMQV
jgi:flagellar hook-basal body complex protein FliE